MDLRDYDSEDDGDDLTLDAEESFDLKDFREDDEYSEKQLDDLLYDPRADELDAKWVQQQREGRESDALLSCPCCLVTVCMDCQQHDLYPHQYRAMFVMNCRVKLDEVLRPQAGPSAADGPAKKGSRKKRGKKSLAKAAWEDAGRALDLDRDFELEPLDDLMGREGAEALGDGVSGDAAVPSASPSPSAGTSAMASRVQGIASTAGFRGLTVGPAAQTHAEGEREPKTGGQTFASEEAQMATNIAASSSDEGHDAFHPVACAQCGTEIAVYEPKEEVFHFFDVLASEP